MEQGSYKTPYFFNIFHRGSVFFKVEMTISTSCFHLFPAFFLSSLLSFGLSHVAIEFITGMFPRTFSSGKIEVVQISIQILTWLPVFGQISTQPLFCYPQQVRFLVRVDLQNIDSVFVNVCKTLNHL